MSKHDLNSSMGAWCTLLSLNKVISETEEYWSFVGKVAIEGKVEHKFDMTPHRENIEEYGKLCRERTNKSMIKNRQVQVVI